MNKKIERMAVPQGYELVKAIERLLKTKKKGKGDCKKGSATSRLLDNGKTLDTSRNIP